MNTLVVAPMTREARAIGGGAVAVGAGAPSGSRLVELLSGTRPDVLLIAGICGALDPSLTPGDLVLSRSVLIAGMPELIADARCVEAARRALAAAARAGKRGPSATFVSGRLLTVETAGATVDERRDLWNTYGAAGIDMETYALARAADSHGVPWLALRVVSDSSRARLPAPITTWRSEEDDRRIALAIGRRPWAWPATIRLAWDLRTALRSLRRATALVTAELEGLAASSDALPVTDEAPTAPVPAHR